MKPTMLVAAAVLSVATPALGQAINVPAFFYYKACGTGTINPDWTKLVNNAGHLKYVVADMTALCSTEVTANAAELDALRTHGVKVLGYVTTLSGSRSSQYVFNGGDPTPPSNPYSVSNWYNTYSGHIDGIFFDEGPNNPANDATLNTYYTSLFNTMRANYSGTCGSSHNQGCVFLNASQYPNSWVTSVADEVVFWEHPLNRNSGTQPYLTMFCPDYPHNGSNCASAQKVNGTDSPWMFTNAGSKGTHVVHSATASDVEDIICTSRTRGSPDLYIHTSTSSNYSSLSTAFDATVDFLDGTQFCVDVNTAYCGTESYDPCGTYLPGCQQGLWCPGGLSCRDAGGYLDCM